MGGKFYALHLATRVGMIFPKPKAMNGRSRTKFRGKRRAYFNVPTGTDVLGDLKSVLEGFVTRA